jgi:elongation factor Ts
MDCKTALNETQGDIEAAVDWLRTKGLAKAAKKAGRVAAEGLVAVESSGHHAAILEVNSETDFVARNDGFQAFAREAAKIALMGEGTVESLENARFPGSETTVKARLQELIATIGENMTLRRVQKLTVQKGVIATYTHNVVSEGLGKIGVLVALESEGDVTALSTLGRQIAMHVAATNPVALDASGVDPATVERESAILREKNAGKPDHVMQKIIESGLKSYYKEVTLVEQAFVHDPSKTVAQVLKEAESKTGAPVALKGFVRFALGEGIEKEEAPDFAAEVAAAAGV